MAQHGRFIYHLHVVIFLLLTVATIWPLTAAAQSGCTGDPCVFSTPTATPSPTAQPTAAPGTPQPTPIVDMPPAVEFPAPDFSVPTSIPAVSFPDVPDPLTLSIDAPDPISWPTLAAPPAITPTQIITSFTLLSRTTNISGGVNFPTTDGVNGTVFYTTTTGLINNGRSRLDAIMSYTIGISEDIAALEAGQLQTITIASAPSWYAPDLPRPLADIGWTFEGMSDGINDTARRYSVNAWAAFAGATVSLPIQFGKSMWELFKFFGPVGLFLVWLLAVMLPTVLGFNLLIMLKTLMVKIFNFVLTVANWVLRLVDFIVRIINMLIDWLWKLWEAIPFVN